MRCTAVVVAGGSGTRFGSRKQFAPLEGRSVAWHSIAACRAVADDVILVAPAGATDERHGADRVVEGGATRAQSVRAGLAMIDDDVETIVVHDAARPLASAALFCAVVAELADASVAGAIAAVEVTDTIKETAVVEGHRRVTATLDRTSLVSVQTPQAFRATWLRAAHEGAPEATDDAALVEAIGGVVAVVPGEVENLKLTNPADLERAAAILELRR